MGTDAFLEQALRSVRAQFASSSILARAYYGQSRRLGAPGAELFAPEMPKFSDDAVKTSLTGAGFAFLSDRIKAGRPVSESLSMAGEAAARAGVRAGLAGGRDLIREASRQDKVALGYYWQTRETETEKICSWCAMLASRGPVYTRESWPKSDPRPDGELKVSAHDNCACSMVPVWSKSQELPDSIQSLYDDWLEVTAGFSGHDKVNAWRRDWDARRRDQATVEQVAS